MKFWTRHRTALLGTAALLAGLYALVLAALWFGQEKLLFRPVPLPAEHRFALGDDVHETWVEVPGARLNALHLRLPHPDGVVFFLHGNAGNLVRWFENVDFYRRANLDLFMIDYRGFGKSSGRITSQAELEADVRAAWAAVAPRYAGLKRIVYGRSLGSGLAAGLATEVKPDLTVLVSAYSSLEAVAQDQYPWVPMALLRYPLHTDALFARVPGPVLLLHGDSDKLIPLAHSQRLLALNPRAELFVVAGAGHSDIHKFESYLERLRNAYSTSQSSVSK